MFRSLLLLAGLTASLPAFAATAPNYAGSPKDDLAQIANANGTSAVTLTTAGTNGSRRFSLSCTSTDTVAHSLVIEKGRGGVSYLLATVSVPASAGNASGTPRVAVLSTAAFPGIPLDPNGNPFLTFESGDTMTIAVTVAVTSGDLVSCEASGVDF